MGAVLLQGGKPIAYATRALTPTQQQYPQIEKEALAIRFGCLKFHSYVYGKHLTIETDHKPLESISKKLLHQAPPRLQRILLDVLQYDPVIVYKKGSEIPVADALSRNCIPLQEKDDDVLEVQIVLPVPSSEVEILKSATTADEELITLLDTLQRGWPNDQHDVPPSIKKYWNFRDELATYNGLLFKNDKVVVPKSLHPKYLQLVHQGHLGIQSCLRRARDVFFWLGMTSDITTCVQRCTVCQSMQASRPKEALLQRPPPDFPWQRVAADLFEYGGVQYILVTDFYSGYFAFRQLTALSTGETVKTLKYWFSVHGIPETLETDNGPQFSSVEFKQFVREWQFQHVTSSPHYPRSNGLAERSVQTAKNLMRKCSASNTDLYLALLNVRNTPRNDALGSPAQRLFSRRTRTLLPIPVTALHPAVVSNVRENLHRLQLQQKKYADIGARPSYPLAPGEAVRIQSGHRNWTPGRILAPAAAPRSFDVLRDDGRVVRRNTRHLRRSWRSPSPVAKQSAPAGGEGSGERTAIRSTTPPPHTPGVDSSQSPVNSGPQRPQIVTRSGRVVRPPDRLDL